MIDGSRIIPENLAMPDAEVLFYKDFFDKVASDKLFDELSKTIHWTQQSIKIIENTVPFPRLTAWYGDEGKSYSYSGITVHSEPWIPTLLNIKGTVETATGETFNSVLLNFYRDEHDSVSWHSDDERELGINPAIASISFGASRRFQFKHKVDAAQRLTLDLTSGSLLLMRGTTQHFWKHQVPKIKQPLNPRINLTFRFIQDQLP